MDINKQQAARVRISERSLPLTTASLSTGERAGRCPEGLKSGVRTNFNPARTDLPLLGERVGVRANIRPAQATIAKRANEDWYIRCLDFRNFRPPLPGERAGRCPEGLKSGVRANIRPAQAVIPKRENKNWIIRILEVWNFRPPLLGERAGVRANFSLSRSGVLNRRKVDWSVRSLEVRNFRLPLPGEKARLSSSITHSSLLLITLFLLFLTGCATKSPPTGAQVRQQALTNVAVPSAWQAGGDAGRIADDWLVTFNDPQLDSLVREAITNNPDLRVTSIRVRQAAEYVELAKAAMKTGSKHRRHRRNQGRWWQRPQFRAARHHACDLVGTGFVGPHTLWA